MKGVVFEKQGAKPKIVDSLGETKASAGSDVSQVIVDGDQPSVR